MKNIIKYKEGEQSWILWIKKRIKNNLNFLAITEGETGAGKSWSLLSIAYQIDKEFESRQVSFSLKQVMETINSDWFNEKKWKIIIFDEAQTEISNRSWQSLTNKLMNYLLSTFRHRNIILLMTSPYSDFLDAQTMKLMHCKFEVRGHNKKKKVTLIRPKLLQYNSKSKKFYEHSLYVIKDRKLNKLIYWYVPKPPQVLIKPYELDKVAFTDRLNKSILDELNKIENKDEKKEELTESHVDYLYLFDKFNGNTQKVAEYLGTTQRYVNKTVREAKMRKLRIENLKEQQEREQQPTHAQPNLISKEAILPKK